MPVAVDVKIWDLKAVDLGTKLVSRGEYCGTTKSTQYDSNLHQFVEIDDVGRSGSRVPLAGGALDYRAEQGDIQIGEVYDVIWKGKGKIAKGKWAGKETNTFEILRYEDDELPAAFLAKRTKPKAAPVNTPIEIAAPTPQTEALDDLD